MNTTIWMFRSVAAAIAVISLLAVTESAAAADPEAGVLAAMAMLDDSPASAVPYGQEDGTDRVLPFDDNTRPFEPFRVDTWTIHSYGSAIIGDHDKGEQYAAHIGVGYHFFDTLSVNLEGFGGWVSPGFDDDDGGVGGFDVLFRWHFVNQPNFSLYTDGGVGFQTATTDFPSDSHFNFRPQWGLGATWEIWDHLRLMGGVRYIHISNAGSTPINQGLDGALVYLGLMWEF